MAPDPGHARMAALGALIGVILENDSEELEGVRAQIQAVIDARVDGSFTAEQADLYERLCDRESELLRTAEQQTATG